MSNRPKARRVLGAPLAGANEGYVSVPAIIPDRLAEGAVEHARKVTHDTLYQAYGPHLRSGVWWTEYVGAEAGRKYQQVCEDAGAEVDPEAQEILRADPRAMVVIAWAIAADSAAAVPTRRSGWVR